ncbi:MAG TPA: site-specific integrase, partial [Anaerolineales bacterium]
MVSDHLPVSRATLEADEFFTACEYDFKCASETIRFYRDKITRFLQWAQQAGVETIDGAAVRRFFRHLVDTKHTENGRHAYLRALRTWFNFLVRRKVIATSPLKDADLRIQQTWTPPDVPPSDQLDRFFAQMRSDIFPSRAKQPRFLPLR